MTDIRKYKTNWSVEEKESTLLLQEEDEKEIAEILSGLIKELKEGKNDIQHLL